MDSRQHQFHSRPPNNQMRQQPLHQHNHHSHSSYHQQQQQQFLINTRSTSSINRNHYSNRQQQQQQRAPANEAPAATFSGPTSGSPSTTLTASSSSDHDDLLHQSSLSSATNRTTSSQAPMLASAGAKSSSAAAQLQREHMMHHHHHHHQPQQQQQQNHHHHHNHQQQQQQQRQRPVASSRQGGGGSAMARATSKASLADQLATSSSSEHTIDDLQQLAHGFNHHQKRLLSPTGGLGAGKLNSSSSAAAAAAKRRALLQEGTSAAAAAASATGGSGATYSLSSSIGSNQSGGRFLLGVLFTLAELLLFATVFLWLYWAYQHDDGLAWQSERKQQFNTHAALMLVGFVFLTGQAMLIHRSFQCCSKIYTKILHTILLVLATSAISLGLILAYTAQENVGPNQKPIMHFYSLHAWCGLATVGLFALQFLFGFVSFLVLLCCQQATSNFRAALLPIHKTFGLIIFSLAVATALMGLLQTARSRLSSKLNKTDYHELAESGIVINLIGVCLICLAILMPYIIRNLDIRRPFRSELDRRLNKLAHLDMRI